MNGLVAVHPQCMQLGLDYGRDPSAKGILIQEIVQIGLVRLGQPEGLIDQIDDSLRQQSQFCQRPRRIVESVVLGKSAQCGQVGTSFAEKLEIPRLHSTPFGRGGRPQQQRCLGDVHNLSCIKSHDASI